MLTSTSRVFSRPHIRDEDINKVVDAFRRISRRDDALRTLEQQAPPAFVHAASAWETRTKESSPGRCLCCPINIASWSNGNVLMRTAGESSGFVPAAFVWMKNIFAPRSRLLIRQHDALRMRLVTNASAWDVYVDEPHAELPFSVHRIDASDADQAEQLVEQEVTRLRTAISLEEGPLIRMALFDFGDAAPQRVFLMVSHLAVDGLSWARLWEDIEAAYEHVRRGECWHPAKTDSFRTWAHRLDSLAQEQETIRPGRRLASTALEISHAESLAILTSLRTRISTDRSEFCNCISTPTSANHSIACVSITARTCSSRPSRGRSPIGVKRIRYSWTFSGTGARRTCLRTPTFHERSDSSRGIHLMSYGQGRGPIGRSLGCDDPAADRLDSSNGWNDV